jgi:hypothetical protein
MRWRCSTEWSVRLERGKPSSRLSEMSAARPCVGGGVS